MTIDDRSKRSRPAPRTSAHELERYAGLFAERTRGMKSSAMRDLMAITQRPEVISLAGGNPDTTTFPAESFAALMSHLAASSTARALQYSSTDGIAEVKDCIAEVMAAEGTHVDPQDVLVTTGGTQVIDLMCKTFIDPGDVVVSEAPTYPGAIPTFSAYQADVVQIGIDADGMRIDDLEETLDRLEREGRRPKFVYTIPTFQNPGGVTMSLARRRRLVEVAHERELLVLEDNPYGLLRYEGDQLPTLLTLDTPSGGTGGGEFVVYLGTFSKILSAGIRLGWAVAPPPVLDKMNMAKQGVDLCSSSVAQLFVSTYFAERRWQDYVTELAALYKRRRDVMLDALAEHFPPEATWTRPQGGMFVWATLPDYIDTTDLLAKALEERNVAFVPGRAAYLDDRGGSSMRLNFSGSRDEDIREGVRRIGEVVREQVGFWSTLTGASPADARSAEAGVQQPRPADPELADVLELPRRQDDRRRDAR